MSAEDWSGLVWTSFLRSFAVLRPQRTGAVLVLTKKGQKTGPLNTIRVDLSFSHIFNRLSVASTCILMCLGAWSKLDFIRDSDILYVPRLPDISLEVELAENWDNI